MQNIFALNKRSSLLYRWVNYKEMSCCLGSWWIRPSPMTGQKGNKKNKVFLKRKKKFLTPTRFWMDMRLESLLERKKNIF